MDVFVILASIRSLEPEENAVAPVTPLVGEVHQANRLFGSGVLSENEKTPIDVSEYPVSNLGEVLHGDCALRKSQDILIYHFEHALFVRGGSNFCGELSHFN